MRLPIAVSNDEVPQGDDVHAHQHVGPVVAVSVRHQNVVGQTERDAIQVGLPGTSVPLNVSDAGRDQLEPLGDVWMNRRASCARVPHHVLHINGCAIGRNDSTMGDEFVLYLRVVNLEDLMLSLPGHLRVTARSEPMDDRLLRNQLHKEGSWLMLVRHGLDHCDNRIVVDAQQALILQHDVPTRVLGDKPGSVLFEEVVVGLKRHDTSLYQSTAVRVSCMSSYRASAPVRHEMRFGETSGPQKRKAPAIAGALWSQRAESNR
jgi:hypothetical protein